MKFNTKYRKYLKNIQYEIENEYKSDLLGFFVDTRHIWFDPTIEKINERIEILEKSLQDIKSKFELITMLVKKDL